MDNTISKNFAIVGQSVTHEYLPEMDIVCGYIQLEFDGEEKLIPVYAMLYDYELIFFENDKVIIIIITISQYIIYISIKINFYFYFYFLFYFLKI